MTAHPEQAPAQGRAQKVGTQAVGTQVFADLARHLHTATSPENIRQRITRAAVKIITGCDHASITLRRLDGGGDPRAATDHAAEQAGAITQQTGPGHDAIAEHRSHLITDLADDEWWPACSRRTVPGIGVGSGIRAVMSLRLFVTTDTTSDTDTIGALTLFSCRAGAFDDATRATATVLAAHAALAIRAARDREQAHHLNTALASSREIGMAMGMLMALGPATRQQAFDLLRVTSQRLNIKLRDVAATVVATGRLPR